MNRHIASHVSKTASIGLFAGLLFSALPLQAQEMRFSGKAYDLSNNQWIYTEQHTQVYKDGRWVSGTIKYVSPSGEVIADKKLDFSADPYIPLTQMSIPGQQYSEAIRSVKGDVVQMETTENGKTDSGEITVKRPVAADSGFHSFVQANLKALQDGKTIPLSFGVVARKDQYQFRIRKTGNSQKDGKNLIELKAEPNSLLRLLADPLTLTYDLDTKNLIEYVGPSNIPNAKTRKVPQVRIEYSY